MFLDGLPGCDCLCGLPLATAVRREGWIAAWHGDFGS